MSASLHLLPSAALCDVPAMFRKLADDIEAGVYGSVPEAVAVVSGTELEIFGFGTADGAVSHYMLGSAMLKMQMGNLNRAAVNHE